MVAAPEFDDIAAEFAQQLPLLRAFGFKETACGEGVADGQPVGQGLAEGPPVGSGAVREFLIEPGGDLAGFLKGQPVAVGSQTGKGAPFAAWQEGGSSVGGPAGI